MRNTIMSNIKNCSVYLVIILFAVVFCCNKVNAVTPPNIYHFDLYRLDSINDLDNIGYKDYLYGKGISIVEWVDKCPGILPSGSYVIYINHIKDTIRQIRITKKE